VYPHPVQQEKQKKEIKQLSHCTHSLSRIFIDLPYLTMQSSAQEPFSFNKVHEWWTLVKQFKNKKATMYFLFISVDKVILFMQMKTWQFSRNIANISKDPKCSVFIHYIQWGHCWVLLRWCQVALRKATQFPVSPIG
jgi:L-rhamnose mutarotase